ncbi:hypothetical protein EXE30_01950 [Acinetobacter halotolerans]|uniref:Uncharacterized protein n=1 Tax=Acinetobacter halotolerans TaxID=1752076 RepID=A0A4Q6XMM1_9GAMM|nr:hypothetical protein [Acinetobacter halotolerans]RZF57045.1 hypothetical protein EXE30_01950 [Acinetobacter halotolerans]
MIVLNHQMSEFLLSRGNTPIPETLELKILEGFYEHADTIVFAFYKDRLEHLDYDTVISRYGDLTGFEASTNRIHIDDYIHNENFTTNEIINIGFSLVQLVQNLWNKLRDDECSIILSSDLESDFGSNASLTFHKKRANEILMDSLDGCLQAVFICDNNDSITI